MRILNRASQTANSDCYLLVNIGTILRTFCLCLTYIRDVTQYQNQQQCKRTEPLDPFHQFYAPDLTRVQYQMLPKSRQLFGRWERAKKMQNKSKTVSIGNIFRPQSFVCVRTTWRATFYTGFKQKKEKSSLKLLLFWKTQPLQKHSHPEKSWLGQGQPWQTCFN